MSELLHNLVYHTFKIQLASAIEPGTKLHPLRTLNLFRPGAPCAHSLTGVFEFGSYRVQF
jgi:hypothetical protein